MSTPSPDVTFTTIDPDVLTSCNAMTVNWKYTGPESLLGTFWITSSSVDDDDAGQSLNMTISNPINYLPVGILNWNPITVVGGSYKLFAEAAGFPSLAESSLSYEITIVDGDDTSCLPRSLASKSDQNDTSTSTSSSFSLDFPESTTTQSESHSNTGIQKRLTGGAIAGITIAALVGVITALVLLVYLLRRRNSHGHVDHHETGTEAASTSSSSVSDITPFNLNVPPRPQAKFITTRKGGISDVGDDLNGPTASDEERAQAGSSTSRAALASDSSPHGSGSNSETREVQALHRRIDELVQHIRPPQYTSEVGDDDRSNI